MATLWAGVLLVPSVWSGAPAYRVDRDGSTLGHVYRALGGGRGWRFAAIDGRGYGGVATQRAAVAALMELGKVRGRP